MAQQSLFGKIIPDRKTFTKITLDEEGEPQVNEDEEMEPTGEDDDGTIDTGVEFNIDLEPVVDEITTEYWNDFSKWSEKCKKEKESYTYLRLDYLNKSNLTETHEWISVSAGLEREWRGTSESYGGSWGSSSYEDMTELKKDIIEFYTEHLDRPYNRELADEWAIRGIRKENIRVFYTDKVREFILSKAGWDIKSLIDECMAMPEKPYDEVFKSLMIEYKNAEKALEDTKDKKWKTDKQLQKYTGSFSDDETDGDIVKGLYEQKKKLKKDEALLEVKMMELRNKLVRGY